MQLDAALQAARTVAGRASDPASAITAELAGVASVFGEASDLLPTLRFGQTTEFFAIHSAVHDAAAALDSLATRHAAGPDGVADTARAIRYVSNSLSDADGPIRWLDGMADAIRSGDAAAQAEHVPGMRQAAADLADTEALVDEVRRLDTYEPDLVPFMNIDPWGPAARLLEELGRPIR